MNIFNLDQRNANKDMRKIINNIKSDAGLYSLAGIVMGCNSDNDIVSELFSGLGSEAFMNFINIFGGRTIKVPTIDEVIESLRFIKLIYLYDFEYKSFAESMRSAGYPESMRKELINRREVLLSKVKGGVSNGSKKD